MVVENLNQPSKIVTKEEFRHLCVKIHILSINISFIFSSSSLENIGLDAGRGPGINGN